MHQVTGPERFDVDKDAVAVVNDFAQLEGLGDDRRSRLRYVLVSHDNDGVTKFGPDLLTTAPAWLGANRLLPEAVPGASPRGIPPSMRWRPITTFFQSLVDMKNAQIPGAYRARAHDYRPDLARFISEVLTCRQARSSCPTSRRPLSRGRNTASSSSSLRPRTSKMPEPFANEVQGDRTGREHQERLDHSLLTMRRQAG